MKLPRIFRGAPATPTQRPRMGVALTLSLGLALLAGLAIAVLPLTFSVPVTGAIVIFVIFGIVAVAPDIKDPPQHAPFLLLAFAMVLYFVWPRYVFIPIPGLPVKHPQRASYLLLLLLSLTLLWKCAPIRQRLSERMGALPWLSATWFALFGWLLVCAAFSRVRVLSTFAWILDFLTIGLLYPLMLICIPTQKQANRLMMWLLVAAVLVSLISWPESYLRRNLFAAFGGLASVDPAMAMQILQEKARGGRYRAQSSFDHPLLFAEYLAVMLPFALAALVAIPRRRWLSLLSVFLIVSGLALSYSRVALASGLIGAMSFAAVLLLRGLRGGGRSLLPLVFTLVTLPVAVVVLGYAAYTVGDLSQGRSAEEAGSTAARISMLYQGIDLIESSPLIGYGPGQGAATLNFRNPAGVVTLDNFVLALGLEGGLPAVVLYTILLIGLLALQGKAAVLAPRSELLWLQMAMPSALLAFISVKFILGTGSNNLLLPILLGLSALNKTYNNAEHSPAARRNAS